jgi:hypothetical protein
MARTAIPINTINSFQRDAEFSVVTGDSVNDMSVDLATAPHLHLVASNYGGSDVDFTVEFPAGKSTYHQTVSKSHTVTAGNRYAIVLDVPDDLRQTDEGTPNLLFIDSADPNFADVRFCAFTLTKTPKARGY